MFTGGTNGRETEFWINYLLFIIFLVHGNIVYIFKKKFSHHKKKAIYHYK